MRSPSTTLLAADIDGTMLGDALGETLLHQFFTSQNELVMLAYVTGRHRQSVLTLIEEDRLPRPHFICSEVGTEILDMNDPSNHMGQAYADQASQGWDLQEIYDRGLGDGIRRQEFETGQPRFQAGFYWDARPESLQAFHDRLSHLEQIYIQASYNTYIDVFPISHGKGKAVRFLQEQLGLSADHVAVAGDSGNDRQMFETGFKGIVPVNALDELKFLASQSWHYHSPYPAGRGVLDGLNYFGFASSI